MRRLPLIPTVLVAGAVLVMIGLGIWQLQRAAAYSASSRSFHAAAAMPALDLDRLLGRTGTQPSLAFRRALITCRAENVAPEWRGGRSRAGQSGYVALVPCQPGADGLAGRLLVNAGWAALPQRDRRLSLTGTVAGALGSDEEGQPLILTAAAPAAPLAASAPANIDDLPNNHLMYAGQWLFFAALAVLIYILALRRRRAPSLPPEP